MTDFCVESARNLIPKRAALWVVSGVLLSCLAGCHTQKAKEPAAVPEAVIEHSYIEDVDDPQESEIYQLLLRANQAMVRDHLLTPEKNNARYWFGEVLKLQPNHVEAKAGVARIGQRYLELAVEAYRAGQNNQAESMLSRAKSVGVAPSAIVDIRRRAEKGQLFAAHEFPLHPLSLAERNARAVEQLAEVAKHIKAKKSPIVIVASNDEEGRWIYQQLRQHLGSYELRGDIQRGKVPYVSLVSW